MERGVSFQLPRGVSFTLPLTPKSQSALLEAMEERQVTVEGQTRALPEPFFVIAT